MRGDGRPQRLVPSQPNDLPSVILFQVSDGLRLEDEDLLGESSIADAVDPGVQEAH